MKIKMVNCSCRHCPVKAERLAISKELIIRLQKALSAGVLQLEETGELFVEKKSFSAELEHGLTRQQTRAEASNTTSFEQTGLGYAGPHALLLTMDHTRKAAGPLSASEKGVDILARFYNARKSNRALLDHLCISSDAGFTNPTTFLEVVVRQAASNTGGERAVRLLRRMLHEQQSRRRIACLLWRRDSKKQYASVAGLANIMRASRTPHSQEDAIRVLAAGSSDAVWLEQLHKQKGLVAVLIDGAASGTEKTSDTAVWLLRRMTERQDCCKLVFADHAISMVKLFLEIAVQDGARTVNRENALAVLANLANYDAGALFNLTQIQILEVAQKALDDGSDQAVKNAATLIGNLAYDESLFPWLANFQFDLARLILLVQEGDETTAEFGLMSLSNLCRMETHAAKISEDAGLVDVLMLMRSQGTGCSPVLRALAERAITNIQIHRWKGSGNLLPVPRRRALGRSCSNSLHPASLGTLPPSTLGSHPFRPITALGVTSSRLGLSSSRMSSYSFPSLERSLSKISRRTEDDGRLPELRDRSHSRTEEWINSTLSSGLRAPPSGVPQLPSPSSLQSLSKHGSESPAVEDEEVESVSRRLSGRALLDEPGPEPERD